MAGVADHKVDIGCRALDPCGEARQENESGVVREPDGEHPVGLIRLKTIAFGEKRLHTFKHRADRVCQFKRERRRRHATWGDGAIYRIALP